MSEALPLSVQAELAEARANADRVRRLEAELRDAQDCASMCKAERDGFAAALVSEQEKRKQAEASIYSMTCTKQAFDELEQVTRERESARNERDALQAKLDGASKVIAEMAATRDRLQAEAEELRTMVIDGGEVVKTQRERIRVLTAEKAWEEAWVNRVGEAERERDAALREAQRMTIQLSASLRTALREVAILRESQRLVPQGLTPKHPTCECAKMPRLHAYDPRSCTAAGDESMRRDG